jgi:hypothetical protein
LLRLAQNCAQDLEIIGGNLGYLDLQRIYFAHVPHNDVQLRENDLWPNDERSALPPAVYFFISSPTRTPDVSRVKKRARARKSRSQKLLHELKVAMGLKQPKHKESNHVEEDDDHGSCRRACRRHGDRRAGARRRPGWGGYSHRRQHQA